MRYFNSLKPLLTYDKTTSYDDYDDGKEDGYNVVEIINQIIKV
jgi:hypothetical protein